MPLYGASLVAVHMGLGGPTGGRTGGALFFISGCGASPGTLLNSERENHMAKQYWVWRQDKMSGPFSNQQLKQMTAAGMISTADMISADQINWQDAGLIKGLFQTEQPGQNLDPASSTEIDSGCGVIRFRCRWCDKPIRSGAEWAGKRFKCPQCGERGKIPRIHRPRSSKNMAQYWLKREDQEAGPFSGQQFEQMVAADMVAATDMISADQTNWRSVEQLKRLSKAKRPVRLIIWAVLSQILGFPSTIIVFVWMHDGVIRWPMLFGGVVVLLLGLSGTNCLRRDADSRRFGYFTGMAYVVLSIVLAVIAAILLASAWSFLPEIQGHMLSIAAVIALICLPYPIITIAVLNSRPVRSYLIEMTKPMERTGPTATFVVIASLLILPLAAYFTYISYDWMAHGRTALATITKVSRSPAGNIVPASRGVPRRHFYSYGAGLSVNLHYKYTISFDEYTATLSRTYTVDAEPWRPVIFPSPSSGNGAFRTYTPSTEVSEKDSANDLRLVFNEPYERPVVGEQLIVAYLAYSPGEVKECSKAYEVLWRLFLAAASYFILVMLFCNRRRIAQDS